VDVGEVVGMLNEGVITKKMGKDIITLLHEGSYEGTMSVEEVVEEHGFKVENDGGALVEVSMILGERRGEGGVQGHLIVPKDTHAVLNPFGRRFAPLHSGLYWRY
jgi:hypothetical protein